MQFIINKLIYKYRFLILNIVKFFYGDFQINFYFDIVGILEMLMRILLDIKRVFGNYFYFFLEYLYFFYIVFVLVFYCFRGGVFGLDLNELVEFYFILEYNNRIRDGYVIDMG